MLCQPDNTFSEDTLDIVFERCLLESDLDEEMELSEQNVTRAATDWWMD